MRLQAIVCCLLKLAWFVDAAPKICTAEEMKAVIQCHTVFMESSNITVPRWKLPDFYAIASKRNVSTLAIENVRQNLTFVAKRDVVDNPQFVQCSYTSQNKTRNFTFLCEKEDGCCDNGCCPKNQFRHADKLISCLSGPSISPECRAAVYDEAYDQRRFIARLNAAVFKTLEYSCDRSSYMSDVYKCLSNLTMIGEFHRAKTMNKVVPDHERKAKTVCDHFALWAIETAERRVRQHSCKSAGLYLCSGFDIIAELFADENCTAEIIKSKNAP